MLGKNRSRLLVFAVALTVSACSMLDPRDIVMSHDPLERLTLTLNQYKANPLSDDEERLLRAFIARAELTTSLEKGRTEVVGQRLRNLLKLQETWEQEARGDHQEQAASSIELAWNIVPRARGYYPTKDMWPTWLVERFELQARMVNSSDAPVGSVSGTLVADDEAGNPVARAKVSLTVPEEVGAVAVGGTYTWTIPVEIDLWAPCESPGEGEEPEWVEGSAKLGVAVRGFVGAHEKVSATENAIATLEEQIESLEGGASGGGCNFWNSAERRGEELDQNRAKLTKLTQAFENAGRDLQKAIAQETPGNIQAGLDGRNYYIPSEPLEVCPRTKVDQAIPADFIGALQLRWIQGEITNGTARETPPVQPATEEPPDVAAADAGATAPDAATRDAGQADAAQADAAQADPTQADAATAEPTARESE